MMKAQLDFITQQTEEILSLVRENQSIISTVDAKRVQNILNQAFIDIHTVTKKRA